ncbi:kinase-like domain-containing protein, partial [Obelidium mucronatum]
DLFHCITSRHGLPNTVIKDLFTQISNAVYFCHQNGVYHRDLKPENILIDTSNLSIRLADFGLATDQEWSDNMGCGSVRYMSPECLGIPIDTISMNPPANIRPGYSPLKNDVWSLGVILINLVFSRNPWHSVKDAFCCTKYLFLQQPALKDEFNLSDEFDAILRRCFDPNPETRCGVLEFRDLVWHCSSFTKDGPIEQEDALPAVPPPPP